MYRASTGHLDHYDEPPRGGERWDRDRFERMRRGGGGGGGGGGSGAGSISGGSRAGGRDDYEHFRFQEHDRFPGGHRDVDIHEDRQRQGPRVMERERFREDDRFERPSRSRTDLFHEPTPSEVANQALAPYRRKSVIDKDINIGIDINEKRRPARPQYIRRQSSLDTFDRRPLPRYGDVERYEKHEYRPPANVPIPLPIRERRRSPPRRFHEEDDFEEIRFDDRGGRGRERENYREVEVSREKSKVRRSKSVAKSTRSSSISSFEEIQPPRATWGKKGKTRLPKRLVKRQAVIDLGYPFEEEDDFIIVTRALEKEHIDEVIKVSESYKEEKMTYVYEETGHEAPPPPPPASIAPPPPPPQEHYPPPPPPVMHAPPPPPPPAQYAPPPPSHYAPSHYAPSERAPSPPAVHEHERFVEIERSNAMHGPATSFLPEGRQIVRRRSERDIRDEIRSLEEERRMLKYERDDRDYEFIEARPARREVVRVDKDRKGRRDRPNPKLVAAMMSTLT
ncbi:Nn.00g022810.m01.CDS01 [Neocucurbitaria sp. VM-36]